MRSYLAGFFFLVLIITFVYSPVISLGFANVDDPWALLRYDMVHPQQFNFRYLFKLFSESYSGQYSPVNVLYYALIYQINEYDPYYFHIGSIVIHLLNVVVLFFCIEKLLSIFKIDNSSLLAFFTCILWAVHPLNIESVAWISASKILLYSFFSLVSFYFFIRYMEGLGLIFYFISLISFIIACFCKEQAVLISLVLVVFCFLHLRNDNLRKKIITLTGITLPFLIISLIFGLITLNITSELGEPTILNYSIIDKGILISYCLIFYIYNAFIPIDLHFHYPFPFQQNDVPWYFYFYPITILIIFFSCYNLIKSSKYVKLNIFCLAFFVLNILLSIQIIPLNRPAIMADRYMYLPLIGLLMILNLNCYRFYHQSKKFKPILLIITIGYFLALNFYSQKLVANWIYQKLY
jgi:hypothetical protein